MRFGRILWSLEGALDAERDGGATDDDSVGVICVSTRFVRYSLVSLDPAVLALPRSLAKSITDVRPNMPGMLPFRIPVYCRRCGEPVRSDEGEIFGECRLCRDS